MTHRLLKVSAAALLANFAIHLAYEQFSYSGILFKQSDEISHLVIDQPPHGPAEGHVDNPSVYGASTCAVTGTAVAGVVSEFSEVDLAIFAD